MSLMTRKLRGVAMRWVTSGLNMRGDVPLRDGSLPRSTRRRSHDVSIFPNLTARPRGILAILGLAPSRRWPFLKWSIPYRSARRMRRAIGPGLGATTTWIATDGTLPDGDFGKIFNSTVGIHKCLHYLPIYEATLFPLRHRPVRMLEIGVHKGGSLEMWRRYLHPDSVVTGIDIDPDCRRFDNPSRNIHVRIGSQQDLRFLRHVTNELGPFDVILDDGSHAASHMVDSFRFLFPTSLAPGGIYIVEDLCANYWAPYRDSRMSFMDLIKWLIDGMHAHYMQMLSPYEFKVGSESRREQLNVPVATLLLEKIEIYDSIAVIHRSEQRKELPRYVER